MASDNPQTATLAPVLRGAGPHPAGRKPKRRWWMRLFFGLLIAVVTTGVGCAAVYVFGQVHGVELCAETLERRSFAFLEIPVIGVQVRGTRHVDVSGDLEKHLVTKKFVKPPPASKKTWHVIHVARGMSGIRRGDPEIVCRYLDARNSNGELAWLEWTKTHPQLAPHIWGGVCELALLGKYTLIPDLLELTQGAADPVETQAEVDKLVQRARAKPEAAGAQKTTAPASEQPGK